MQKELEDLESDQVESFETRLKELQSELAAEQVNSDKLLDSCGFLRQQTGEVTRTQKLADGYQKRK